MRWTPYEYLAVLASISVGLVFIGLFGGMAGFFAYVATSLALILPAWRADDERHGERDAKSC